MPELQRRSHVISSTSTWAHSSLCILLVAQAAGCLITDVPENEPITRGRPQLINPDPPPTEFLRIIAENNSTLPVPLSAFVLSEDNLQDLQPVLLIDYGVIAPGADPLATDPWTRAYEQPLVDASTLAAGPRKIDAIWFVEPQVIDSTPEVESAGCHSVTLLVTHKPRGDFPGFWCPEDPTDFDAITWYATVCTAPEFCSFDCPIRQETSFSYCEALEAQ